MKDKIKELIRFLEIAENNEASPQIKKEDVPVFKKVLNDYLRYHDSHSMFSEAEKFKEIEKALGFDLFIWQKTFISMGVMRHAGETTARCLRSLVFDNCPIDFSNPPSSNREKCERYQMLRIKEKLDEEGIQTNPIFTTKREVNKYLQECRNHRITPEGIANPPVKLWRV